MKYLDLVRNQACGLHSILGNSWGCSCNIPHKAYLRLHHPSEASHLPPKFGVAFPSRQSSPSMPETPAEQETIFWKHTSISVSKIDGEPKPASLVTALNPTPLPTTTSQASDVTIRYSSSLSVTRGKKSSRVQFLSTTQTSMDNPKVFALEPSEGTVACSLSLGSKIKTHI